MGTSSLKTVIFIFIISIPTTFSANYLDQLLYEAKSWVAPVGTLPTNNVAEDVAQVSLFQSYPTLQEKLHYVALGTLPTPIKKLENLGSDLNVPNFYLKDDGQINANFGGGLVRKLEFILADALANNAKYVMSRGYFGSDSVMTLSFYAKELNLEPIAMLHYKDDTELLRQNLLVTAESGAEIHYHPSKLVCDTSALNIFLEVERLRQNRKYPYWISQGFSNELGAIAFLNAALELKQQIDEGLLPEPDYIFLPFGTMGMAAGIVLGLKVAGLSSKVICVRIEYEAEAQAMLRLIHRTAEVLNSLDPTFIIPDISTNDFVMINNYYNNFSNAVQEKIAQDKALLQDKENIVIDSLHSDKVFSACLNEIENKNLHKSVILFWNTFSNFDFSHTLTQMSYTKLPDNMHILFK